ncbi:MAG TPA: OsmC family protein [Actinomycetota bacterium]|jgi:uncharacterized OsmC-like protein|nr:OsmC family protein [Actinomycetota bacterium]
MTDDERLSVSWEGQDQLRLKIRDHDILLDQPQDAGGTDLGPTPTELFVGSLIGCMTFYAERFLKRNDVDPSGLTLAARYSKNSDPPHRVSEIDVQVSGGGIPERLRRPLLRVMDACLVHESLRHPPNVVVHLEQTAVA